MPITGHFHGGITVRDMETSLRYYVDGLGLEVHLDRILDGAYLKVILDLKFDDIRAVYLRIPNETGFVELLEYRGIERMSAASRPCDFGSGHLCFYVDDVDAAHARLTAMGYRARSSTPISITTGPNEGARSMYTSDPDGYWIELFQKRPSASSAAPDSAGD